MKYIAKTTHDFIESSFEAFDAKGYLSEYYSVIDYENEELLKFYVDAYKDLGESEAVLEFGGGPTIYALIAAAAKVKRIDFCDCIEGNLKEVQLWKNEHADAFNWDLFIKRILELEGAKNVSKNDINNRANLLRQKLTKFLYCDAFKAQPLGYLPDKLYDVVQTNFVAESITTSKEDWESILKNISTLVAPSGILLLSAIKNSSFYHLSKKRFPAVSIYEQDLITILKRLGFTNHAIIRTVPSNPPYRGYDGFIFIKAKRSS